MLTVLQVSCSCRLPSSATCYHQGPGPLGLRRAMGWCFFFEKPKVVKSVYSMDIHGISMVHLWSSMVYLCYIYGICMVCVWYMYGMCMGYGRCNGMECNGMEWDIYIYPPIYSSVSESGYTGIRYTHHMAEFSESIGIGGFHLIFRQTHVFYGISGRFGTRLADSMYIYIY